MFMCLGPNSVIGAGILLPILEYTVMYAVQVAAKIQRERIKSMEVKPEAVRAFDEYIEVSRFFTNAWCESAETSSRTISPK